MTFLFPALVVGFIAGVVAGSWLTLPGVFLAVPAALGAFLLVSLILKPQRQPLRCALAVLLFASLGAIHGQRVIPRDLPGNHVVHLAGYQKVDLEGRLIQPPEIRGGRTRLLVQALRVHRHRGTASLSGLVLITVANGGERFQYGDRIRLRGRLTVPRRQGNPAGLDWKRYLALKGVLVQGFVRDAREILLIRRHEGGRLRQAVEGIRRRLSTTIRQEFPSPAREILLALVVGERWALAPAWREAFAALGVSHLLAISGLHLGLIAVMTYAVARWLLVRSTWLILRIQVEKCAWVLTLPVLMGYAAIAGLSTATQRALIMITALIVAHLLDRQRGLYHSLGLAALLILVIHPSSIYELSFQLSFLAVLGILYALPRYQEIILRREPLDALVPESMARKILKGLILLGLTSASALLATLPVSVFHFHRAPAGALPANLVLVPLVGFVVLPTALAGSGLLFLWPAGGLSLLWVSVWMIELLTKGIEWGAHVTGGGLFLPTPRPWEVFLFYGIFVGICNLHKVRWTRWLTGGLVAILVGLWVGEAVVRHLERGLRVHVLAVGNGAAVLVEGPRGHRMLLDGGGLYDDRVDIGALQVAPVLWQRRVMSLDHVVLSHPHPDHMNGLRFILRAFRVGALWDNGARPPTEAYETFRDAARQSGLAPRELRRGTTWRLGDAVVEVLHPPSGWTGSVRDDMGSRQNNGSAVLRISLGEVSFLFPGDIEAPAEAWLLKQGGLRSTVLLAPHHGSRTSSTDAFIEAVSPRCVVFSAQAGPRGLAHPRVIGRYRRRGIRIFHTGRNGMVSFLTDGRTLRARTHSSETTTEIQLLNDASAEKTTDGSSSNAAPWSPRVPLQAGVVQTTGD